MFKSMLFAPGFLLITALAAHSADAIGFRETEIDQGGTRPLHISISGGSYAGHVFHLC